MTEQDKSQLKASLLEQLKDKDPDVAAKALRMMEDFGWVEDGSLQGADFRKANLPTYMMLNKRLINFDLTGVDFSEAYLREVKFCSSLLVGAKFTKANMGGAWFDHAHLENAVFNQTNLERAAIGTYLRGATFIEAQARYAGFHGDLQNVSFQYANLVEALFAQADLRGASFTEANLQGMRIIDCHCDNTTILPNGTRWNTMDDWAYFTNPDHPDFWRSKDAHSPAYRDKSSP